MVTKRRDNKGRVLREGESQREDGMYMYRYTDQSGKRRTVYSWRLVETDAIPAGKRKCNPLRETEKQIGRDIDDGIFSNDANAIIVDELFKRFMELRIDLKEATRCNYRRLYTSHVQPYIGHLRLKNIKASGIQKLYTELFQEQNLKPSTVQKIHAIVSQMLDIAVRDNMIRANPAESAMKSMLRIMNTERDKRHALTIDEQTRFIEYVGKSRRYNRMLGLFTVLLWTGVRIGEALGLRWSDIDFERNIIDINHILLYKETEAGGYAYRISSPKTKAGVREVPMFSVVRDALLAEKRAQMLLDTEPFEVDGYKDFVFLNSAGKVYTQSFVFDTIQNIIFDYNKDELVSSKKEHREPVYLPKFSAHNLRHTFCTRLCENETNLKVIQDVMGHKNIRTTMDVYNEATASAKQHSFEAVEGKLAGSMFTPIYTNLNQRSEFTPIFTPIDREDIRSYEKI